MRYFDLFDDMRIPRRWALKSPVDEKGQEVDPGNLTKGALLNYRRPFGFRARVLAALWTSLRRDWPYPWFPGASFLSSSGWDSQAKCSSSPFPARVAGQAEPYFILNRNVVGMRIDPSQVGDAHIFRPWGWRVVIIVSEYLKQAMEAEGITGPRFIEV